jgi:sulfate permease, SulP family
MSFMAKSWRDDLAAGAITTIISLPISIAASLLAFAPLGPSYTGTAAGAGLIGAIIGGGVAAIVATSSFVGTTPRASECLILASLLVTLLGRPEIAADKNLIVTSIYLCVFLAGLFQCLFGLAGVAKIIKFTPHPVLVGFLNGVAVLIILSQLKPYFLIGASTGHLILIDLPWRFALCIAVAAAMLFYPALTKQLPRLPWLTRIPAVVVGFCGGIGAFYIVKALHPALDLGATFGTIAFPSRSPFAAFGSIETWRRVAGLAWDIVPVSAILAIVATIDSLLTFRSAQNVSDLHVSPVRDVVAQGIGNCAAAFAGGMINAASPSQTVAAYRAGGRSRLVPLTSVLLLAICAIFFPNYLGAIPMVVLSGILLAVGVLLVDQWFLELVADIRKTSSAVNRRRAIYDVAVVFIVMGVTVFYSIIAGVVAGCLLAGTIFVVNMSRPVIRRTFGGADIQSKRIRPARDVAILRETGAQRAILQLEGVLFFGNADDLSAKIKQLFAQADMITLDLRGVSDIDVSGATILENIVAKSHGLKKDILFCEVPASHINIVKNLVRKTTKNVDTIKHDLDACLEWMEEKSLHLHADKRLQSDILALHEIDFLDGLEDRDLEALQPLLTPCNFAAGETICREGEDGDRMWLLAKGSVSVRLALGDGRGYRRITSLARGTTLGEMALVESSRRSATVVADEPVFCYELLRSDFDSLVAGYPGIATKLLSNLSRELARRLRRTSEDLRNMS